MSSRFRSHRKFPHLSITNSVTRQGGSINIIQVTVYSFTVPALKLVKVNRGVARGERWERTLPLEKGKVRHKKNVGVKNLKTLKGMAHYSFQSVLSQQ